MKKAISALAVAAAMGTVAAPAAAESFTGAFFGAEAGLRGGLPQNGGPTDSIDTISSIDSLASTILPANNINGPLGGPDLNLFGGYMWGFGDFRVGARFEVGSQSNPRPQFNGRLTNQVAQVQQLNGFNPLKVGGSVIGGWNFSDDWMAYVEAGAETSNAGFGAVAPANLNGLGLVGKFGLGISYEMEGVALSAGYRVKTGGGPVNVCCATPVTVNDSVSTSFYPGSLALNGMFVLSLTFFPGLSF